MDVPGHVLDGARTLPTTEESVNHLCTMGNCLLDNPDSGAAQLYESFCFFRVGKDLSVRVRGVQDATNLYNMACACCRMSAHRRSFIFLPPWAGNAAGIRNVALLWLVAAVGAGWTKNLHMKVNPDLEAVCVSHAAAFAAVVNLAARAKRGS